MMQLVLQLSPEEEAQFEAWAAQQGEAIQQDARALSAAVAGRAGWETLLTLFLKAGTLTQSILGETVRQQLSVGQYLLLLLKTMTALYHANGGRPFTPTELFRRTPLDDATTLYDLRVVSLGTAAQIAKVSVSEFIEALRRAGVPVFQYGPEEVLAEVGELEAR
jgi:hypothetical protein